MRQLDQQAKDSNIIIINECGVDPGTDHMSAMKIIHDVQSRGGKVVSFKSYCGGLPAPDNNNNPFGYKLSWAPRGVLLASRNNATFLQDGKTVTIPGKDLFDNYMIEDTPIGKVEGYPNRDSTQYLDVYGLKDCKTIIRGTYRYPGWCSTIKKIGDMGYLSIDPQNFEGKTYAEITARAIGASDATNLRQKVAEFSKLEPDHRILSNMEWIGLFSNTPVPSDAKTYLDALCAQCKDKLRYAPGEKDMLLMKHEFIVEFDDRKEWITSTLIDYGIPHGNTSMSRTVSLPVAIAVRLVLDGHLKLRGLQFPTTPEVYTPILKELEDLGIKFVEKLEKVEKK
jgi:saccharopine dehydrogenase (NADP+, L-glutamate forming)/spermidine synthase